MSTLCLDLGTKTGWALIRDGVVAASGTEKLTLKKSERAGHRYIKFYDWLQRICLQEAVEHVSFEEVHAHKGVDAAHVYGGLCAHMQAFCDRYQIDYNGVGVGTIKKHATGKGNAKKEGMIEAAKDYGHSPSDDNEADAICLAYYWIEETK